MSLEIHILAFLDVSLKEKHTSYFPVTAPVGEWQWEADKKYKVFSVEKMREVTDFKLREMTMTPTEHYCKSIFRAGN